MTRGLTFALALAIAFIFTLANGAAARPLEAEGPPQLPHAFYGSVTINGLNAPPGTTVEAGGTGVSTGVPGNPVTTTVSGIYGSSGALEPRLVVQGDIPAGATITFYVNGVSTGQTYAFNSGSVTEIDLKVTIPKSIGYSPASFSFSAERRGVNPPSQTLSIWNIGVNTDMNWTVSDNRNWLSLSPASGRSTGETDSATLSVNIGTMSSGTYTATITIQATGADNTPRTVPVTLIIYDPPPPDATSTATPRVTPEVTPGVTPAVTPGATPEVTPPPTPHDVEFDLLGSTGVWPMNSHGILQEDVDVASPGGEMVVHISSGTVVLGADNQPIDVFTVNPVDPLPPSPEGGHVLAAFDFLPDGTTFDPGIEITIAYDPNDIPEGMGHDNLFIGIYNEQTGEWQFLSGTVNPETNTVTFTVTHFTVFAVLALPEAPAPPPTPKAPLKSGSQPVWVWIVSGIIGALALVLLAALLKAFTGRRGKKKLKTQKVKPRSNKKQVNFR